MNSLQLRLDALLPLLLPCAHDVDVPQPHELALYTLTRLLITGSQRIVRHEEKNGTGRLASGSMPRMSKSRVAVVGPDVMMLMI